MFRKFALIAGAVMALVFGVASAPAPAAAQVGFGVQFGPGYGYGYGPPRRGYYDGYGYDRPRYYGGGRHYRRPVRERCERVVIRKRVYGEWRRIVERRCYGGRRGYY
jgi:hypothetical protein